MNPPKTVFFGIIVAVLVTGVLIGGSSQQTTAVIDYTIPAWVKGIAGFWAEDKISDQEFGEGLSFLIDNDIIKVAEMEKLQQVNSQLKNKVRELEIEYSDLYEKVRQGFFSSSQVSGTPTIEAIKILGYDARAVTALQAHNGNQMLAGSAGDADPNKQQGERIAIYLTNDSVQKIVLGEVSFGGYIYQYVDASGTGLGAYTGTNIPQGNYAILTQTPDTLLSSGVGELAPGQTATIVLDLDSDQRIGRSSQFKITTSNGNVFVGTISVGQQSG